MGPLETSKGTARLQTTWLFPLPWLPFRRTWKGPVLLPLPKPKRASEVDCAENQPFNFDKALQLPCVGAPLWDFFSVPPLRVLKPLSKRFGKVPGDWVFSNRSQSGFREHVNLVV